VSARTLTEPCDACALCGGGSQPYALDDRGRLVCARGCKRAGARQGAASTQKHGRKSLVKHREAYVSRTPVFVPARIRASAPELGLVRTLRMEHSDACACESCVFAGRAQRVRS